MRQEFSPHRIVIPCRYDAYEPGHRSKPTCHDQRSFEIWFRLILSHDRHIPGWMHFGWQKLFGMDITLGKIQFDWYYSHSSNMGTSKKFALSVPKEYLPLNYVLQRGFDELQWANLLGETNGIFNERPRWSDFWLLQHSHFWLWDFLLRP